MKNINVDYEIGSDRRGWGQWKVCPMTSEKWVA